jgi:hypothetical protein
MTRNMLLQIVGKKSSYILPPHIGAKAASNSSLSGGFTAHKIFCVHPRVSLVGPPMASSFEIPGHRQRCDSAPTPQKHAVRTNAVAEPSRA